MSTIDLLRTQVKDLLEFWLDSDDQEQDALLRLLAQHLEPVRRRRPGQGPRFCQLPHWPVLAPERTRTPRSAVSQATGCCARAGDRTIATCRPGAGTPFRLGVPSGHSTPNALP